MNKRSRAREAALTDSRNVAGSESGAVGAELVRHLQVRDEAQRSAIARLLHHDVSGMLAAARMDLSRISGRAEGELREQLDRVDQILEQVIKDARREMQRLHPALLDHFGLAMAIRHYVDEACRATGIQYKLELPEAVEGIDPQAAIAAYRLLESLTADDAALQELGVALHARRDGYLLRIQRVVDGSRSEPERMKSADVRALRLWLEACGVSWSESRAGDCSIVELRIPREPVKPSETQGG